MNVIIVYYGLHLLAEGVVEFLFSSQSYNGAILGHINVHYSCKNSVDMSEAARQSDPLFASSLQQSEGRSGDGLSVTERGGGIKRKL